MSQITKEMIYEAADALVAAGESPKVASVRNFLGKGSFTTINEVMKQWRAEQKPVAPVEKELAPQAVTEKLLVLGADIWKVATELALEGLREEREELEATRIDIDEQLRETAQFADDLTSEVERLQAQNEELKGLLEIERASHESTRGLYQMEIDSSIKMQAKLELVEQRLEDAKEAAGQQKQQYQELLGNRDKLAQLEREQAVEIVKLKSQEESLREQADRAKGEAREVIAERNKSQDAAQAAQLELVKAQALIESLNKQLEQQAKMFESLKPAAPKGKGSTTKEAAGNGE